MTDRALTVGIVGLGLIGGSFAKALKAHTNHRVLADDRDKTTLLAAQMTGDIDGVLDDSSLPQCDVLLLSLYPEATVDYLTDRAKLLKKNCTVIDCCGVKRFVCERIEPLAKKQGFLFIGGHPMAGAQFSGFSHARDNLFKGASMILAAEEINDILLLERLKKFFTSLGFEKLTITTPEEHDRIIAYTSQLAHVVSNAYIKSPTAQRRSGFSAGSFRDMTRVARLNVPMWTELFLENGDFLAEEIDLLIKNLQAFSDTIKAGNAEALSVLLRDGAEQKKKTLTNH